MFGLGGRLVLDMKAKGAGQLLEINIDWLRVAEVLGREREKAMNFLKDNLES